MTTSSKTDVLIKKLKAEYKKIEEWNRKPKNKNYNISKRIRLEIDLISSIMDDGFSKELEHISPKHRHIPHPTPTNNFLTSMTFDDHR